MSNKRQVIPDLRNGIYNEVCNAINHGLTLADILSEIKRVCETAHQNNPHWEWDHDADLLGSIIPKISN